jgi:histone-lysine N-methyltransferase SETMAR
MLIVFFVIRGMLYLEFAPEGQTVNVEFYCNVLRRLREDIRRKRSEMWRASNWLFHDDNAPTHRVLVKARVSRPQQNFTIPHPSYSPDLAPCDFFFFPKMKLKLKVRRFNRV